MVDNIRQIYNFIYNFWIEFGKSNGFEWGCSKKIREIYIFEDNLSLRITIRIVIYYEYQVLTVDREAHVARITILQGHFRCSGVLKYRINARPAMIIHDGFSSA